jgi:hypothetical protein
MQALQVIAPVNALPNYIRTVSVINNLSDKHDQHYAQLLTNHSFRNYVMEHDMVHSHAPTAEPDLYRAMSSEHIRELFDRLSVLHQEVIGNEQAEAQNNEPFSIETFLSSIAIRDGFVILVDDWNNSYIYIYRYANRYEQWVFDGEENGPTSHSFFV